MNPSKLLRPVASFITSLNIRTVYNIRAVYNMGNSNSSRGGEAAAKSEAPVSQEGEKAPTTTSRQGEKQAGPQEEEEEKPQKAKVRKKLGILVVLGFTDLAIGV